MSINGFNNDDGQLKEMEQLSLSTKKLQSETAPNKKQIKSSQVQASAVNESTVSQQQLVKLLEQIGTVERDVIDTIEANGWYESIEEIEPSVEQFEKAIYPIVKDYFTEEFIAREIMDKMEAFFCFCDAPSPLVGKMHLDIHEEIRQSDDQITIVAYQPANQINSGSKFNVMLKEVDGTWKIASLEQLFGSHEESFELTVNDVIAFYNQKEMQLNYLDTRKEPASGTNVHLFEIENSGEWIAVNASNWYTIEGKQYIEQVYEG